MDIPLTLVSALTWNRLGSNEQQDQRDRSEVVSREQD